MCAGTTPTGPLAAPDSIAGSIRVIPSTLADGRELIYFDDADTRLAAERPPDLRALPARDATGSMRLDVLTGDWVSIAVTRQDRVLLPLAEADPLAPQSAGNPSEIPGQYDVAVLENRSPSFGPATARDVGSESEEPGPGRSLAATGRCEVICFSPDTNGSFAGLTASRARTVIEAWAHRTAALSALPGVQQVFPFENHGEAIGVTLHHPHGQIYAYPYVTPRTRQLMAQTDDYRGDLFGDLLQFERAGERFVAATTHFTAFTPFAARWPIELHVLPNRHVADLTGLTATERDELAPLLLRLLRAVDALYDDPTPYIAAWHQAPVRTHRDEIRLSLQITSPRRGRDRLKYLAGSESAMGAWIGDLVPEDTASRLRDALARADAARPVT